MDLESRAKLVCAFVLAYADCWFSHAKAHLKIENSQNKCHAKFFEFDGWLYLCYVPLKICNMKTGTLVDTLKRKTRDALD